MFVNNQTKWNDELVVDDNEGKYVQVYVGGGGGGVTVSPPRLLAVRLFSQNPWSSYLSRRDCKPRRYVSMRHWDEAGTLTPSFIMVRGSRLACVLEFR